MAGRKLCALGLALALTLSLGGCGGQAENDKEYKTLNLPVNDGAPAKLTVQAPEEFIGEIVEKYRADFPQTEIVLSGWTGEGADIVVTDKYADKTGLMDLSPYADAWESEARMSNAASRIMYSEGGESIYTIPLYYEERMLYYRCDWFDEYNEGRAWKDQVRVDSWKDFLAVKDKLGERGKYVGSCSLTEVLWSVVGLDGLEDLSAAVYPRKGGTIFAAERTQEAVELFGQLQSFRLGDGTVQDFLDGRAAMYLGREPSEEVRRIRDEMPEGSWKAVGLPGNAASLGNWSAWGVCAGTEEPEKAAHFLWYLTNLDNSTHIAKEWAKEGVMPIYRESVNLEPSLLEGDLAERVELLNTPSYQYASLPLMMLNAVGKVELPEGAGMVRDTCERETDSRTYSEESIEEHVEILDRLYTQLLDDYTAQGNSLPWEKKTEGTS